MTENYLKNYLTLGIAPGASWKQLRQAYKKLIKTWHPDRFQQDARQKRLAEEKTKEINQSYKELAEYYKKNGVLPLENELPADLRENTVTAGNADFSPAPEIVGAHQTSAAPEAAPTERARKSKQRTRIMASLVLLSSVYFIWQFASRENRDISSGANHDPASSAADMEPAETVPEKRFTIGSSLGEVYSIQGVPTRAEKDVWHYGNSKIYFSKGKVFRWEESPDSPLRVDILPELEKSSTRFFGRGSTKEEVLAAQGRPDRDAGSVWDYGLSRVYFEKDRVTGWQEGPLNPLRVRK